MFFVRTCKLARVKLPWHRAHPRDKFVKKEKQTRSLVIIKSPISTESKQRQ